MPEVPNRIWAWVATDGEVADFDVHKPSGAYAGMWRNDPSVLIAEYVPADAALAWIKDRHLAWCRGEANETALGFDDWITEQWAAAGREADR